MLILHFDKVKMKLKNQAEIKLSRKFFFDVVVNENYFSLTTEYQALIYNKYVLLPLCGMLTEL